MIRLDQTLLSSIQSQMPSGIFTPLDFFKNIPKNSKFYLVKVTLQEKPRCEIISYTLIDSTEYYGAATDYKDSFLFSAEPLDKRRSEIKDKFLNQFLISPDACFVVISEDEETLAAARYYRSLLSDNWQDLTGMHIE